MKKQSMLKVVIRVEGGIAEVGDLPPGVEVEIRDYDIPKVEERVDEQEDKHGTYVVTERATKHRKTALKVQKWGRGERA